MTELSPAVFASLAVLIAVIVMLMVIILRQANRISDAEVTILKLTHLLAECNERVEAARRSANRWREFTWTSYKDKQ